MLGFVEGDELRVYHGRSRSNQDLGEFFWNFSRESYAKTKLAFKTLVNCKKIWRCKRQSFFLCLRSFGFCKHLFQKRLPFESFPISILGCFSGAKSPGEHQEVSWILKPENSQKPWGWLVPLAQGMLVTTRIMIFLGYGDPEPKPSFGPLESWEGERRPKFMPDKWKTKRKPLGLWFLGITRDLRWVCANRGLWQAVFKCTKACEQCWVLLDNRDIAPHQYVVQEYLEEKKWTAEQPLPAARVATFPVVMPHLSLARVKFASYQELWCCKLWLQLFLWPRTIQGHFTRWKRLKCLQPPKRRRQGVASIHVQNSCILLAWKLSRRKRCGRNFLGDPEAIFLHFGPLESWEGEGGWPPIYAKKIKETHLQGIHFFCWLLPAPLISLGGVFVDRQQLAPAKMWQRTSKEELGGGNSNIFLIFIPTWGRFPFWLIFFKGVATTNQKNGIIRNGWNQGPVTLDGWMVSRSTCWRRSSRRPRRCWCHQWNLYQVRNFRKKKWDSLGWSRWKLGSMGDPWVQGGQTWIYTPKDQHGTWKWMVWFRWFSWKSGGPYSQVNHVNLPGCMGVSGFSLDVPLEVSKWLGSVGYFTYL